MTIEQKKKRDVSLSEEESNGLLTLSNDDDKLHYSERSLESDANQKITDMMDNGIKRSQTVTLLINNSAKSEHQANFERNKRILLVDDEPYNLIGLTVILQQAAQQCFGHHFMNNHQLSKMSGEAQEEADLQQIFKSMIDKANNGLEAVKLVKKAFHDGNFSYGLIFMDCSMPIMDGFEATDIIRNKIRSHAIHQPMIVACTGHTEDEYIKKAWRYQMDEVIPKPSNFEVIKQLLQECVEVIDDDPENAQSNF
uniref:Response regulatory domain-containing protein n=1 Tax=Strombidium inclinatum TaxID=197538 RepID=A0A7S3ID82_9SPIT|mmetsp:Transcript_10431/g.16015  ORF Transcript_10431/g.16015 Transcript_10431/m.16015 type:complete len:253 (+) Transcript_10431:863-1621(+)